MSYRLFVLALLLSLIWPHAAFADETACKSAAGHYTVTFPKGAAQPAEKESDVNSSQGTLKVFDLSAHMPGAIYTVVYFDFPEKVVKAGLDSKRTMEGMRDDLLKKIEGKASEEKADTVQGFPSLSFHFSGHQGKNTLFGQQVEILAGGRMYSVRLLTLHEEVVDSPAAAGFFSSFRLDSSAPTPETSP